MLRIKVRLYHEQNSNKIDCAVLHMYQILERSVLLRLVVSIGAMGLAIAWCIVQPSDLGGWLRALSFGVGISLALTLLIGFSPIWRWIWRAVPSLNHWIFPDLNGEWDATMDSNIAEIAKHHPALKGTNPESKIQGKITIKQNWFFIAMTFRGDNGYSNSDTIVVKPTRTPESGRFGLAYVYCNHTPKQLTTDEQMHYGAGIVEVHQNDGKTEIEGNFWTNRKWPEGLNTAGIVKIVRTS